MRAARVGQRLAEALLRRLLALACPRLDEEIDPLARRQREHELGAAVVHPPGRLGEGQRRGAQHDRRGPRRRTARGGRAAAAAAACRAAAGARRAPRTCRESRAAYSNTSGSITWSRPKLVQRTRSYSRSSDSARRRSMWIAPRGVPRPFTGGSARLVPWKVKTALSRESVHDSRVGWRSPTRNTKRESRRVSRSNRPSAPPMMSPLWSADQEGVAVLQRDQFDAAGDRGLVRRTLGVARRLRPCALGLGDLGERRQCARCLLQHLRLGDQLFGERQARPGGRRRRRGSRAPWRWPRSADRSGGAPRAGRARRSRGPRPTAASSSFTMKPVTPSSITSGAEPQPKRHHRRAAGHGLDHHQAERLGPVDREQQRRRRRRGRPASAASPISPMNSISGWSSSGSIDFAEVGGVGRDRPWRPSSAACRAAWRCAIARSGPFSGDMRPRKAR